MNDYNLKSKELNHVVGKKSEATMSRLRQWNDYLIKRKEAQLKQLAETKVELPEVEEEEKEEKKVYTPTEIEDPSQSDYWRNFQPLLVIPESVRAVPVDTQDYSYTSSENSNRELIKETLKHRHQTKDEKGVYVDDPNKLDLKLDDATIEALLVHIGAESGYNSNIKNPNSSAYGLGQWIAGNHQAVLDYINNSRGTNYKSITDLSLDDLAEAAAHWYYDNHKSSIDSKSTTFDKVKQLAKIGLGPALLSSNGYTGNGKVGENGYTYHDTDEDWLKYFHDTGHDGKNRYTSFNDHINARFKSAGYTV